MKSMIDRVYPMVNDRLNRCFLCFIIGFIIMLEAVMIIPWLPQFYENAIQFKLHELGALAERKVFEKQTSAFDQPEIRLPDGNAYGIIGRSGQMIWYGDQATTTAAR